MLFSSYEGVIMKKIKEFFSVKIKKEDFVSNRFFLSLIVVYTIIIALIYGYLFKLFVDKYNWPTFIYILTIVFVLLFGGICFYLSLRNTALKRINSEEPKEKREEY
jgi:undecaprenyl pyrophosphate phosphatase UppP